MPDPASADTIRYLYRFKFSNGTEKEFEVRLNAQTLELMSKKDAPKPAWTKLKYFQCSNCPLSDDVEYCPVAVNLSTLVEAFKDSISFEPTSVRVQTAERTYEKEAPLQRGLSSIVGMYMVTSNCPVLDHLRPMVRFHLPFPSMDETVYRTVSMYLTSQFLLMRKGEKPDWELKHLVELFKALVPVNRGMSSRLSHASNEDANVNAVIILATQGTMVPNYIESSLSNPTRGSTDANYVYVQLTLTF